MTSVRTLTALSLIGGEGFARLQLEGGGYVDANDFQLSDGGLAVIM